MLSELDKVDLSYSLLDGTVARLLPPLSVSEQPLHVYGQDEFTLRPELKIEP